MAGNLFRTALDSMWKLQLKDTYGIGTDALAYFYENITDTANPRGWGNTYGYWVDDHGWWGLAFLRTYLSPDQLGYDADRKTELADNAKNCWEALNASWDPTAITWTKEGTTYTITGGIPNTAKTPDVLLAGRNRVTNELYWYLSSALYGNFGDHYRDPNANGNSFFRQALDQSILLNSSGLVYERFLGLPNTTNPSWTWLGDQGLFAGCCYFNQQGTTGYLDKPKALKVINAVQVGQKTSTGVLHEDLAPFTDFRLDYACGKGTLMRHLSYVNDDLQNQPLPTYDDHIKLNAQAVWKNRQGSDGIFPYYWNAELPEPTNWIYRPDTANAVLHAAGLSAINGTLPWLKNQPIDGQSAAQAH
ncbi:hypothetical protein [Mycobacterium decipiens]|uniref:Linalool dehydratase/isomerase domain-containing protein n=1 Tax=Mycobacterium decipiens TaxID=1430326 RepID=A0A1X2LZW8_9MYCO|nr:hypothetical protein [Mycobacterium decipiens]OSC42893.1 hypothetical protein B8W66_00255 [Mycobacterium decipiens]